LLLYERVVYIVTRVVNIAEVDLSEQFLLLVGTTLVFVSLNKTLLVLFLCRDKNQLRDKIFSDFLNGRVWRHNLVILIVELHSWIRLHQLLHIRIWFRVIFIQSLRLLLSWGLKWSLRDPLLLLLKMRTCTRKQEKRSKVLSSCILELAITSREIVI